MGCALSKRIYKEPTKKTHTNNKRQANNKRPPYERDCNTIAANVNTDRSSWLRFLLWFHAFEGTTRIYLSRQTVHM